ncbi:MAG: 30S ribosomal protein S20 [Pseudomonadota bacterium]|nr:30S ribosomal protein S20 [Pseudomonadota bacterium]
MANSPQAIKRARQNDKRRAAKTSQKSLLRTNIKNIEKACTKKSSNPDELKESFMKVQSYIDKSAKKIIHPNKASRLKKRLTKLIKEKAS